MYCGRGVPIRRRGCQVRRLTQVRWSVWLTSVGGLTGPWLLPTNMPHNGNYRAKQEAQPKVLCDRFRLLAGNCDDSRRASKAFLIRLLFWIKHGALMPRVAHQGNSLFGAAQPVRSHQLKDYHSGVQRIKKTSDNLALPTDPGGSWHASWTTSSGWDLAACHLLCLSPIPKVPGEWIAFSYFCTTF